RSKAGLLAGAVALGLCAAGAVWSAAPHLRRRLGWCAALLAALLAGVHLVPQSALAPLERQRYVHDLVRVVRLDELGAYLAENRTSVWTRGAELVREHPLAGVGLAGFPRAIAALHDPTLAVDFNPLMENAHCQVLQWAAELGLPAALLGCALFALAL